MQRACWSQASKNRANDKINSVALWIRDRYIVTVIRVDLDTSGACMLFVYPAPALTFPRPELIYKIRTTVSSPRVGMDRTRNTPMQERAIYIHLARVGTQYRIILFCNKVTLAKESGRNWKWLVATSRTNGGRDAVRWTGRAPVISFTNQSYLKELDNKYRNQLDGSTLPSCRWSMCCTAVNIFML